MRYKTRYGYLSDLDESVKDELFLNFPFERNFPGVEYNKAVDALLKEKCILFFDGDKPVAIIYFSHPEGFDGCFIHFARISKKPLDFRKLIRPVREILNELLDKSGKFKYNNVYGWTPYGMELRSIAEFFGFKLLYTEVDKDNRMFFYKKER